VIKWTGTGEPNPNQPSPTPLIESATRTNKAGPGPKAFLGPRPGRLVPRPIRATRTQRSTTNSGETHDLFALIEQVSGQRLGSAVVALEAIPADSHSAATLQVPDGAALLMLERLISLDDGRPVDLEYIRMRGDRITVRGSLIRAEPIRSEP
jgi:hypothetical protein